MRTIEQEGYFKEHQKKLYNFCLKLTKDRFGAEDLFQDTWLKAIEKRDQYRDKDPYEPWLMAICINLYRDYYRHNRLTTKLFQVFVQNDLMDRTFECIKDTSKTTEELAMDIVEKGSLIKELNRLDDKYRLPLILCYYNGYSYSEIAKVLGIKEGTVKSRISTGKAKLKERMVSYEG